LLVSATTTCYPLLPLDQVFSKLVDLEYSTVEIAIHESGPFKPSQVLSSFEDAVNTCRDTMRLDIIAFDVIMDATGDEYYRQFDAICRLAKATKVVTLVVRSGELGTPFNEEVERLRKLVDIAVAQGAKVGLLSQTGRLSQDPDTLVVLCDNVNGLGVTLDPSHYIYGPHAGRSIDKLMKYVYHVHLRDTSRDQLQVRVGQGEVDYGRLIQQLEKVKYNRGLSVDIQAMEGVDHMAELRKMRLLLESLL